jgi:serine/threonine protein kinase
MRRNHTRKRKNKRSLAGGKVIAQGSYGCGFVPALMCKGDKERPEATFTKLLLSDDANKEWLMRQHIARIDPAQKYSIYPNRICKPDYYTLTAEDNIYSCSKSLIYYKTNSDLKFLLESGEYSLLQIPLGGKELGKVKVSGDELSEFLVSLRQLISGLVLMHSNRLYHLDIKQNNILTEYTNNKYNNRYIDFGLSRTGDEFILDDQYPVNSNYSIWPYEMRFLENYKYMKDYGNNNEYLNALYNKRRYSIINDLKQMYRMNDKTLLEDGPLYLPSRIYFNKNKYYNGDDYFKRIFIRMGNDIYNDGVDAVNEYLEKVDVYSLGLTLSSVFINQTGCFYKYDRAHKLDEHHNMILETNEEAKEIVKEFYKVILGMLHPDPKQRFTAREAEYAFVEFQDFMHQYKHIGASKLLFTTPTHTIVAPEIKTEITEILTAYSSNPAELNLLSSVHISEASDPKNINSSGSNKTNKVSTNTSFKSIKSNISLSPSKLENLEKSMNQFVFDNSNYNI